MPVSELTRDHWAVVNYIRSFYEEHGLAPLISQLHEEGHIDAVAHGQVSVFEGAVQFARAEGILPAPESAHAIRSAIDEALEAKEQGDELLLGIFSETVILSWEIKTEDGKWKKGLEDPDTGEVLKAEPANYRKVLGNPELKELFAAVQEDATGLTLYLKDVRALEAKNS